MNNFYAKVDTINQTSYETNTMSVLDESGERLTLRIDENELLQIGDVYYFETEPIIFKEKEQRLVNKYTHMQALKLPLHEQERLMRIFYTFAPVNIEVVKESIESYLDRMRNETIKKITMDIYTRYQDAFYLYPAATKFHHAYIGGLAHHTETMMRLAEGLLTVYPFLDYDLLVSGLILHDVCKTIELSDYKAPEYTKEGRLIGHITMGVKEVTKTAIKLDLYETEERLLIEHMILSHHYYGNFGSPKKPNIPEALALHFIDNIDSKFAVLGEALELTEAGDFTQPIPVLDRERYYKRKV
ncbi:HD domain-containing protein [Liberiplasma polymorphum]|jgi:3'-5' exoribonuclease|uniref:HD domain-containing protein n=1 Tax=Liberiplasma polymorphum TaxID=3374570 RepID=UPI003774D471